MRELSIMVDESGEWGKLSKYYLITLVFHDQSEPVMPHIERYEQHLADASLPDIPFHAGPLLNGHADYETLSMADRKRLFVAFFTLARNLPFTYVTFAHRKSEFDNDKRRFEAQLRRDLANYLLTHLDRFRFLGIKPYDICHVVKGINSVGDLPEKHNLVIFIIRFKPHYFCNISFIRVALVILAGKLE